MKKIMWYGMLAVGVLFVGSALWTVTARAGYESAEYRVVEKDGSFEIREYPELVLASTDSNIDAQGRDGSFMRLFGYISGANEAKQKIAMTTPVFMQAGKADVPGTMGFVVPKDVAASGTPSPKSSDVEIRTRAGGRYAVLRFSGRLNQSTAREAETKLRSWIEKNGWTATDSSESAGYDPPLTPGPLRRNEVLIRLEVPEAPSDPVE